jgi:hypothetical protein
MTFIGNDYVTLHFMDYTLRLKHGNKYCVPGTSIVSPERPR